VTYRPLRACARVLVSLVVLGLTAGPLSATQRPLSLTDGDLEMIVNPSVGRIVSFKNTGGDSCLWVGDDRVLTQQLSGWSLDYGGDKLWPACQDDWPGIGVGWPPPRPDGAGYDVTSSTASSVSMVSTSTRYDRLKLDVDRQISLDAANRGVLIENRYQDRRDPGDPAPIPACIWSITQSEIPEFVLMDVNDDPAWPGLYKTWQDPSEFAGLLTLLNEDTALRYTPHPTQSRKLGTFGEWIAAVYSDKIFLQRAAYDPTAGTAYRDGSNLQCYSSTQYVEIETLSPSAVLDVGEEMTNEVAWYLLDRPAGLSDADLAAYLAFVPAPGDANRDGAVSDADYTIWADNYGVANASFEMGDFNGDGEVTDADYTIWADHYGQTGSSVPGPTALSLLALGALRMLRRRYRPIRVLTRKPPVQTTGP
jgi:MYXO-CTERM domain-containing protein